MSSPFDDLPLKGSSGAAYVDPMEAETSAWMVRTKRGDPAAFDLLTGALRQRAFQLARSWVGSHEDALELAQEAFLKTYRARDTYREEEPFLPWFQRILRNTCFSFLRKEKRLREMPISSRSAEGEPDWEIEDGSTRPELGLEGEERVAVFWQGFRRLSAKDREILTLRHFQELSYGQIARVLGIPEGTVMSRLFHARAHLRTALGGYFAAESLERGGAPVSEPTRDELLAMAYVDGELTPAGRAEFEVRLAASSELRRAVTELQSLELLARAAAPREPMDHEWAALARDPVQRGALGLGFVLGGLGLLGLGLFGLFELCTCDAPLGLKLALAALLVGGGALLGATLRARLRTLPLDPYRKVQR